MSDSKSLKIGKGKAGPGRPKGMKNRVTVLLKQAILNAASDLGGGGQEGLEKFLRQQATKENNAPFMSLLARVLPSTLTADSDSDGPLVVEIVKFRYSENDAGKTIDADPGWRRIEGPTDNK
jgi:hypothetical protein